MRSDVILVADAGDFIFYDCVYEELLQALGPINDDSTVPWTMFNDNVQMGFFGVYDQYILNILYHPRIRPGMTRAEVRGAAARRCCRRCGRSWRRQQHGAVSGLSAVIPARADRRESGSEAHSGSSALIPAAMRVKTRAYALVASARNDAGGKFLARRPAA